MKLKDVSLLLVGIVVLYMLMVLIGCMPKDSNNKTYKSYGIEFCVDGVTYIRLYTGSNTLVKVTPDGKPFPCNR